MEKVVSGNLTVLHRIYQGFPITVSRLSEMGKNKSSAGSSLPLVLDNMIYDSQQENVYNRPRT